MSASDFRLRLAAHVLHAGGIIAYPTEAVFGLGCDPDNGDAVARLLALKGRPMEKGLILVAADFDQLTPYLAPMPAPIEEKVRASWPGPVTWLLPARPQVPQWLRGEHETLAVRVSAHPTVAALCRVFDGAVVSTSANRAGQPPARSELTVQRIFGAEVDYVLHGALGRLERPTQIRDAQTDAVLRG